MPYTVTVYDSLESTNLTAKALAADGAPEGTVVVARRQEKGRGRLGRSFYSPAGTGLYMSVILRPTAEATVVTEITTAAAVAVAQAIEQFVGESVAIKWVNDIYYRDRKVCGILAEGGVEQGTLAYVILGIGINVSPPEGGFPADIAEKAGTLFDHPVDVTQSLTEKILTCFDKYYRVLGSRSHLEDYRRRSWLDGKQVTILSADDTPGDVVTVQGVADDFSLLVTREGECLTLRTGDVSVLPVKYPSV